MTLPLPHPEAGRREGERLEHCLLAVARGAREAFTHLYRALFPQVRAVVQHVLRDRAQSEEVAQEVIVELWTLAGRYQRGRGSVHGWAATIARRRAVDQVRRQCARIRREQRVAHLAHSPAYDSVVEGVEQVLDQEGVRRVLGVLSPLQGQAIRLAFYEGRSHAEVASSLGIPLGTAKSRIREGLIRLRLELDR
ncbi:sigma-70 family RNA polymerase sigma factor [Streptacidiphilus sp. PAMC 29251]